MEDDLARQVGGAVRRQMPVLDGLRGLAIAMVVVHNAGALQTVAETPLLKAVQAVHGIGWVGVQLFFVLSGFLITGILVDTKGAERFYSAFYARRALRIFPVYYGLLFAWLVVLPHLSHRVAGIAVPLHNQGWYWSYLSNWAQPFGKEIGGLPHFWSLAVEEQFYLVWPLCVVLLSARALGRLALSMIFAALALRIGMRLLGMPHLTIYMFTFARMDALAMGAALALVVRDGRLLALVRPWIGRALVVSLVGLAVMAVLTKGGNFESALVQTAGYTLFALLSAVVILRGAIETAVGRGRVLSLFDVRSLRVLGKYSYGLYVFHYPIIALLRHRAEWPMNHGDTLHRMMALVTFVGVVSVLSMAAAMASYELIERHCLSLKRFFVARPAAYGAPSHSGNG